MSKSIVISTESYDRIFGKKAFCKTGYFHCCDACGNQFDNQDEFICPDCKAKHKAASALLKAAMEKFNAEPKKAEPKKAIKPKKSEIIEKKFIKIAKVTYLQNGKNLSHDEIDQQYARLNLLPKYCAPSFETKALAIGCEIITGEFEPVPLKNLKAKCKFHSDSFLMYWSDKKLTRDMIDTSVKKITIPYANTQPDFDLAQVAQEKYVNGSLYSRPPITCILASGNKEDEYKYIRATV